ncbi:hypothetical protein K9U39_02605 [Rhodoblastus acidophilus]|uniref:Uncharacterized protein n=1 Tax=Candidatus Rhodoblastus alkanivorans TaxID=2954117 RepID=A0ABS9Z4H7_9HYPH|nr:hypothetical protein [Candidatus Rhodoblastus alkanivorans]MCI4677730.1 hypothetical protein [Candidatus Rhodoblastus alkanivorans]MCI4682538.1 hypothetical protein [Candidatus Rhodoblastus alkanivorans]MDI4639844.1 hypothetical protein [Rhodoblastus acidophilus]
MAKGQVRGNKEAKKPKADQAHANKRFPSAYQKSQGKEDPVDNLFKKKT